MHWRQDLDVQIMFKPDHNATPRYSLACSTVLCLPLQDIAPEGHTVRASTSTLAKLLAWRQGGVLAAGKVSRMRNRTTRLILVRRLPAPAHLDRDFEGDHTSNRSTSQFMF